MWPPPLFIIFIVSWKVRVLLFPYKARSVADCRVADNAFHGLTTHNGIAILNSMSDRETSLILLSKVYKH